MNRIYRDGMHIGTAFTSALKCSAYQASGNTSQQQPCVQPWARYFLELAAKIQTRMKNLELARPRSRTRRFLRPVILFAFHRVKPVCRPLVALLRKFYAGGMRKAR